MKRIKKIILEIEGQDNIELEVDGAHVNIENGLHTDETQGYKLDMEYNGNRRIRIDAWNGIPGHLDSSSGHFGTKLYPGRKED